MPDIRDTKFLMKVAKMWELLAIVMLDLHWADDMKGPLSPWMIRKVEPGYAKQKAAEIYQQVRQIRSTSLGRHIFKPMAI